MRWGLMLSASSLTPSPPACGGAGVLHCFPGVYQKGSRLKIRAKAHCFGNLFILSADSAAKEITVASIVEHQRASVSI